MKFLILLITLALLLAMPVSAVQIQPVPGPDAAEDQLPDTLGSFWADLMYILRNALGSIMPHLREGISACWKIFAAVMLVSLLQSFDGTSKRAVHLCGVVGISCILLSASRAMIHLAGDTVLQIADYGKLLLPVMTTALAAQGALTTSAGLYAITTVFNTVLSSIISRLLLPMVTIFMGLSIMDIVLQETAIHQICDVVKKVMTWLLRTSLYIFVAFISITGVISGTTDQMTLKATKLTISGAVPIVGNILSDTSEAVLVSIGVMKNAAGVYGILVIIAIFILPFLRIGIQYLLLKITGALCQIVGGKENAAIIECFASAMGFLLAMTGAVCIIQLISVMCFMKGIWL